jgi:DNA helicase-2/ATP-dependent DNA helicase PcrA
MTELQDKTTDDLYDAHVDDTIAECLAAEPPCSFFLFAGAGSGKTRSLVRVLKRVKDNKGSKLRLHGQQVGVITYTNKACDEIKSRLGFDDLFTVSTIHSFAWSLIEGFNHDIREWLKISIPSEIAKLEEEEQRGRKGTKASMKRQRDIAGKNKRLQHLPGIKRFIYSPDTDNTEREALNHSEVIKICSGFLEDKPLMQDLLAKKFPILLIDESQDTSKKLMESLRKTQAKLKDRFALGVIGDMMQRIYMDGDDKLDKDLPADWVKPEKLMNHRSSRRIVDLINKIRESVDGIEQRPRKDKGDGVVRLFILPANIEDKQTAEDEALKKMADITGDDKWLEPDENVKTLVLEHRMAAKRLGFLKMWNAINGIPRFQTGLRDGKLPGLHFFSHLVLPLVKAHKSGDMFALTTHLRKESLIFKKDAFIESNVGQLGHLKTIKDATDSILELWADDADPSFLEVLQTVAKTNLLSVPDALLPFASELQGADENKGDDKIDEEFRAFMEFLQTPFNQIGPYSQYTNSEAQFDTHQGVKGLEYPRVRVLMDDEESRGRWFSYEKLFGARAEGANKGDGKETSIDRTRRLFYVTCSRAENSLALIAYSQAPELVKGHVIREGWFYKNEVETIGSG